MEVYRLILLTAFFSCCTSQHRRNFRKHQNRGRNNHNHSHRNIQFQHFHRNEEPQNNEQQNFTPSFCQEIVLLKVSKSRWYGSFIQIFTSEVKGLKIEIEFNEPVIGFVNDFQDSKSPDNRVFVIKDDTKSFTKGNQIQFNFFVNFNELSLIPVIMRIRVNHKQICPEETENIGCTELELSSFGRGSWKGILKIYPHQYVIGRKIDFIFDVDLLAFVNDIGDSSTLDQKRFTVTNFENNLEKNLITVNFLVRFDPFEKAPMLDLVFIDDIQVCVSRNDNFNISMFSPNSPPLLRATTNLKLDSLPFKLFPNITRAPEEFKNDAYECGLSINSLNFRLDKGDKASSGQFPFHAAIYFDSVYRCAATLISEKNTLTAAHCVVDSVKNILPSDKFDLLFGSVDLESLSGNENLRKVSKIIRHPDYRHEKILRQDIAIITTNGSVVFSDFIRPICMSELLPQIQKRIGKEMTVLGFGSSAKSVEPSRYLHYGKMTIISRDECTDTLIFALLPEASTFCAKSKESSLCKGDSGGSIVEVINNKYYLRGIASVTITSVNEKCNAENPVGFTDVYAFTSWIKEILSKQ